MKPTLVALSLVALPAWAEETLAVLAVADSPGPEPELVEMTHQLRAACRDRTGGVQEVPDMRQRLLGQASNATLAELERAYGGALATYQNGEYVSSIRTLYAVIDDLEKLPEGPETYSQWIRANLRLAHAESTIGHVKEMREAMERVLAMEPRLQPDPDLYSPSYRRDFEGVRARVSARQLRQLTVDALGWSATVYVNGKAMGTAPVSVLLPPGRYRVGGSAGTLRVPSFWIDLRDEDRAASLDFGLAEALRVSAGPGLALVEAGRPAGIIRAGAWLGVDRILATSIVVENQVPFLVGSLYDIRRGALQREGRVRMSAGAVPTGNLAALASFLLTGQHSRVVVVARGAERTPPPARPVSAAIAEPEPAVSAPAGAGSARFASPELRDSSSDSAGPVTPAPEVKVAAEAPAAKSPERVVEASLARQPDPNLDVPLTRGADRPKAPDLKAAGPAPSWMRPAMWGSGATAAGLTLLAIWQGIDARRSTSRAQGMLRADGALAAGVRAEDYDSVRAAAQRSRTIAYTSAAGAAVLAVAAGAFGWLSYDAAGQPAVRF